MYCISSRHNFQCLSNAFSYFDLLLHKGHHEDIGLICKDPHVVTTTFWAGLQWIQTDGYRESTLLYTDIEYAGLIYDYDESEFITVPAISSIGTPPYLDNVNVVNNYGDGVKFTDVSTEAAILDCQISQNAQTGLYVSTVGMGKMYVGGSEINENGGLGLQYNGKTEFPEDTHHYKFCGYNMSIGEYMYLEHVADDFIDPYECVQVG